MIYLEPMFSNAGLIWKSNPLFPFSKREYWGFFSQDFALRWGFPFTSFCHKSPFLSSEFRWSHFGRGSPLPHHTQFFRPNRSLLRHFKKRNNLACRRELTQKNRVVRTYLGVGSTGGVLQAGDVLTRPPHQ